MKRKGGAHLKTPAKLPIGIEDFKKIRTEGFYYVDKTGFISELLRTRGTVNLFTRPRRFGKSLNMDMLKSFLKSGQILHSLRVYGFMTIQSCAGNIWENIRSCS